MKKSSFKPSGWRLAVTLILLIVMTPFVSATAAPQEKVVRWANGDWKSLDPAFVTGALESYVVMNLYSGLVTWNYGSVEVVPDLATSWDISPDGTVYTFKLRQGVKFHKGFGECTAEDVKYSFDRILDPKTGAYLAKNYKMIKEVKVVDKYTVQFTLDGPYGPFLTLMVPFKATGIVKKEAVEKFGDKFGLNPVGTGPFEWVSGNPRADVVLKAFDEYYAGRPKLDKVIFPHIVDDSTAYVAFEGKDLDMVNIQDPEIFKRYKADPKIEIQSRAGLNINYLVMNTEEKPFSELKVRQAVAHAINQKALIDTVLQGLATPLTGPIPNDCDYYEPNVTQYPYDPAKAKKLLAEAGYPNGFDTTIYTFIWGPAVSVVTAIQGMLKEVGINAKIQADEPSANFEKVSTGKTPIGLFRLTRPPEPHDYLFVQLHPQSFPQWNFGHYNNPKVIELMAQGLKVSDSSKRKEIYSQIQKTVKDDCPNIWLYSDKVTVAYHNYVKGYKLDPLWTKRMFPATIEK
jgi:peptide/nickel transport system substrate-binding protein